MTSPFRVEPDALVSAAPAFETQARRFAAEVELLSGLGVHSGAEGLRTGAGDVDATIGGKVDEIIEALAGAGEYLRQTSMKLISTAQSYEAIDRQVAGGMDMLTP
jgi:hypothetical protein